MKKILSIILSLTLAFGLFAFAGTEPSYAASKKPAKVTGLSIRQASDTTVKVSWKKAKNAKKYQVYRKAGGEKSYKCVKTTKSRSYIAKQTRGRYYSYKVRGVNGKYKGKYSSVKGERIDTTNIFIRCDQTSIKLTNKNACTIYFDTEYNNILKQSYDSSMINLVSCSDVWNGSTHRIKCVVKAKKSGTSNLTLTVDGTASCTVEIMSSLSDRSITANVNSLSFTTDQTKQISFTCKNIATVDYTLTGEVAEIVDKKGVDGVVTFTIRPKSNGTGYLQVSDENDAGLYCKITIKVNMPKRATISTPVPFSSIYSSSLYGSSIVRIEECSATISSVLTSMDSITINVAGTYEVNPERAPHTLDFTVYDNEGYIVGTGYIIINPGNTGERFRVSKDVSIFAPNCSSNYTIKFDAAL